MGMLDGKVAIVTGSGHGIGRGHAMELAKHGAKVIVNDLGGSVTGEGAGRAADETVALIEAKGGEAAPNYGDVSNHDQCGEMVQQAIDTYGKLDIVVNNAGIVRDAAIWNMPVENWDLVMAVHVRGTWSLSHFAAKYFREQNKAGAGINGRIINTTSGAGLGGNFGQTNYATAKAAIAGLTLTLAQELASLERHRELHRPRRPHPHHRHHARCRRGLRARRRRRGRVPPHGPEELLAARGLAGQRRGRLRHRPDHPLPLRPDHLMKGWSERVVIESGDKAWDATKLGPRMAAEVFGVSPTGHQVPQGLTRRGSSALRPYDRTAAPFWLRFPSSGARRRSTRTRVRAGWCARGPRRGAGVSGGEGGDGEADERGVVGGGRAVAPRRCVSSRPMRAW